jgi:hypothetical protein
LFEIVLRVRDRQIVIDALSITPEYLRNKASESGGLSSENPIFEGFVLLLLVADVGTLQVGLSIIVIGGLL